MIQVPEDWEKVLHALAAPTWIFTIAGVAALTVRVVLWIKSSRNGHGNGHGSSSDQMLRLSDKVDEGRDRVMKELADTRHALRNDMLKVQGSLDETIADGFDAIRDQLKERVK